MTDMEPGRSHVHWTTRSNQVRVQTGMCGRGSQTKDRRSKRTGFQLKEVDVDERYAYCQYTLGVAFHNQGDPTKIRTKVYTSEIHSRVGRHITN